MIRRLARHDCLFTVIVLMCLNLRTVEGRVVLTNVPPRRIEAFAGETVKFAWDYTVDNKNMDFGYFSSSPVWTYVHPDGTKTAIAVDDGLHQWRWTISWRTCPRRLLYPTVRVRKESVATLVISNVTKNDSGWYEISLKLRTSSSITDKAELVVTDKLARFTKVPPTTVFVAKGKTVRLKWNYIYDNRNIEFHPESPMWAFIDQNGYWTTIATEKKDQKWTAVINETTCPARLLNPLRVSIERPATLVISNVTEADNGKYGCMLRLRRELPINSTSTLVVTDKPEIDKISSVKRNISWFGNTIFLRCVARGVPVPNVTWYGVTGRILMNGKSNSLGSSTLRLDSPDDGIYRCLASNRYGMAWHNVTMTHFCPCKLTQSKKKIYKNHTIKYTKSFADFTASIVLLALFMVSILINVLLCLILVCKVYKAGQAVCDDSNPEPPMAAYSESTANTNHSIHGKGGYGDIPSASLSSLRINEHPDPISRQKGFQTFGNHQ